MGNKLLRSSEIQSLLLNSTNQFNYPNILKVSQYFKQKTCIVCDTTEGLFIQSKIKKNVLVTNIEKFRHVIKRESIEKILIVSINHSLEYRKIISEYLANNNMSIPIYNWFSDVLINLSVKKSIDFKTEETKEYPKLLAILCTPRSGSQMLCDLISQTKAFGYPKEHLTMPIVLPAEKNILDINDWFSKLIAANCTTNNICSTKLIASRVHRLINSIQKDKTINYLNNFKFIVLKRRNIFAQAISLYFAKKSNQWHVNKKNNFNKKKDLQYNYQEIEKIYSNLKQQEKNINEVLEKVAVPQSNILSFYYEDIVVSEQLFFQNLANFMEVEFQDSWISLSSNLTRVSSEAKMRMEKRFRQEFLARQTIMNQHKPKSKIFVVLANRRTGSNYLMKVLDSFPDIEFFGEVYHWDTVWMPTHRKQEYIKWLETAKSININIGEKPFEDKELVKFNHKEPNYFLDFLALTTKNKYAGFKIFPEHLSWQKLEANLLSNKEITKIILNRNLLDVYISDKILQQTKHSQGYDTSNIKIQVDCIDFKKWYFDTQSYYSRIELYLKNDSQKWVELCYEDIHSHTNDREKVNFIYSWLNKHGFEIKSKPKVSEYTKKQDRRNDSLGKVENAQELKNYLHKNNLQHLIHR